ncbi:MAG: hemolysin family protein [Deltaproteobacteria bacterium]
MISIVLGLAAVVFLVLLNGFFVAAEFALVSVRKSKIDQLVNEGSARARLVQKAIAHLDTYIAATQLGITMSSLALGFIGEPAVAVLIEPLLARFLPPEGVYFTSHGVALVIAFSIATALHIVIGELAPKSIALQRPDGTALWVTAPLDIFLRVFRPFIYSLNWVGNAVVRLIGLKPVAGHASVHSVEELGMLIRSSREAGVLAEHQEEMVAGVFEFGARYASQVMTPRTEIDAVPITIGIGELAKNFSELSHSRLPIYEDDLDHILGVVLAKDVLSLLERRVDASSFDIRSVMRKVPFVPENLPLDKLMGELRRKKSHLAVVIDEFGGTAGLVTLEDMLEEIVGEVADEYDVSDEWVRKFPDGSASIDGLMTIEEANSLFGLGIEESFYDTLGGYIFGRLQRTADVGDVIGLPDGRTLRVTELDDLRIARALLSAKAESLDAGTQRGEPGL